VVSCCSEVPRLRTASGSSDILAGLATAACSLTTTGPLDGSDRVKIVVYQSQTLILSEHARKMEGVL